jgi:hypothetical protein
MVHFILYFETPPAADFTARDVRFCVTTPKGKCGGAGVA